MARVYLLHSLPSPVIVNDAGVRRQFMLFAVILNSLGSASEWLIRARRRSLR